MKPVASGLAVAAALLAAGEALGQSPVPGSPDGGGQPPVAPSPSSPQAAVTPPPPKPAPELDSLKPFLGRWRCDGKAFATPISAGEHPIVATAEARLEMGGFWQSYRYEEKKTKVHRGLRLQGFWGYDQGAKRFVRAAIGSQGEWETASATGWEGDHLVWTGEISGPVGGTPGRIPFRQTFTRKGDRLWTNTLELRAPDGRWTLTEEVSCKR